MLTIARLEELKDKQSYVELEDGVILDVQTISLLLQVYKAIKKVTNKDRFRLMLNTDIVRLCDFCWGQVR